MSDTPIYDEVRAFVAARARQAAAGFEDPDEELEAPWGCSWCGLPLDDIPDRRSLLVQDPVAGDEIVLAACSAEHAEQLRHRYRVTT